MGKKKTPESTEESVTAAGGSWTGGSWTGGSWTGGSWTGGSWTGGSWTGDVWDGCFFFFSSRRRHTRFSRDWSSDVCSSDLLRQALRDDRDRAHRGAGVH